MKRKIIVMVKVPAAGTVKTRLQPFLTPQESAAIAGAFIKDAESKLHQLNCDVVVCFSPANQRHKLERLLKHSNIFVPQNGDSLGLRMANAFESVLGNETAPTLMVGTDCVLLKVSHLESAFAMLEAGSDAVVGPTEDGGFYLIGLNESHPAIFENVDWSTGATLRQTLGNLQRLALRFEIIEKLYDIDEETDLRRLAAEPASALETAPQTANWLKSHAHVFNTEE